MADEPQAARSYAAAGAAGVDLNLKEIATAQTQIDAMAQSMKGLKDALNDFSQSSYRMADSINRHMKAIGDQAAETAKALNGVSAAVGGTKSSGGGGSTSIGGKIVSGANSAASAVSAAGNAINRVAGKEILGGLSLGTFLGGGDDFAADLMMSPLRYLRSRINTNRDTAMMASGGLNMQAVQQGTNTAQIMRTMARFPGSIYGTPQDMMGLFGAAPSLGASYDFSSPGAAGTGQGVRAKGFFQGIREMQMLNPMTSIGGEGGAVQTLGSYSADTGSQQRAQMLTGGAMGMIGAGGRQKSLSEWAESILKWFQGLRAGPDRGKQFDHGQLMAQYFPGSNIDAWFTATGVPQNMRDYWWTYALGKAKSSPDGGKFEIGSTVDTNNVAFQRLRAGSELTRTEFGLAGQMNDQYARREVMNNWFNQLIGQMQRKVIPGVAKSPLFSWISYLPDSVEDLLMTGAERGMSKLLSGGTEEGGDIGDTYGSMGGTGLSGLHPDMKSKVGAMMKANPKLRMTSGLRDTGLQQRLKAKGHRNVSGKPSAHTRGMAADLGPRSQYNWIAKNAGKFGLASGKGHGEPWHVGMKGDIPGMGDIGDPFKDFIGAMGEFSSGPEGLVGLITSIMNKITGGLGSLMGGGGAVPQWGETTDDLFNQLVMASKNTKLGTKGEGIWSSDPSEWTASQTLQAGAGINGMTATGMSTKGTKTGWSPTDPLVWLGTNDNGRGDRYTAVAGPDIWADITSADPINRGKAVAKVLSQAGFKGEALKKFMQISYRESRWTANSWNPHGVDRSGGILQANQKSWTKDGRPSPFTVADIMDPAGAAQVAWDQYNNVAPVNGPGGKPTMHPWHINGDAMNGIPAEAISYTDQALRATGLGDVEAMQAAYQISNVGPRGAGVAFNNTFNLSVPTYGSGGSGGIDVRRTVTLLADHLEDEMARRMKRTA